MIGKAIISAAVCVSLAWPVGLAQVFNLAQLRSSYMELKSEHSKAQQSENGVGPLTGETLSDLFEYKSMAQTDYIDMLEAWLVLGLAPSLLIITAIALGYLLKAVARALA